MGGFKFVLMRGGTSKALFFHEKDLPENKDNWTDFLLDVMGSPDKRQIDGMGGGNSLTSKVAIIGKSKRPDADVDYTFGQVSLTERLVDFNGNCGNISSAVAPFAANEGLVKVSSGTQIVRVFNTNTNKVIDEEIQTENGAFKEEGECRIPGVPGTGSPVYLSFRHPQGAVTGKLLPTGNTIDRIQTSRGWLDVSIVDSGNPIILMRAADVGLTGMEQPSDFTLDDLTYIEEVRSIGAELCGFCAKEDATKHSPAVPKATIVSKSAGPIIYGKDIYQQDDIDIVVRMMSMQQPHQALAITGAIAVTTAAAVAGTLVQQLIEKPAADRILHVAHPSGVMACSPEVREGELFGVKVVRTARRIAEGTVYTKQQY